MGTRQAPAAPTTELAGLLLVDKPAGLTSHDVVARVRRAIGCKRVGHAGTLDPFATGLLVLLVGRGTRLMPYIQGEPKVYDAVIAFGAETDTEDVTGEVTRRAAVPDDAAISGAVEQLTGAIDQLPPAYSAKQVGGVRAYAAARRGAPLDLAPSRVTVFEWRMLERAGDRLAVRITCSGGTYIRALARDLGRASGSAAHLASLRRIASGPHSVDQAQHLDAIESGDAALKPLIDSIPAMPLQAINDEELVRASHGNTVEARVPGEPVALVYNGQLAAIAFRADAGLRPRVVLVET